jgi:argininosuccinate lyase
MTKTGSNTMWGGRFAAGPDAIMEAINASIGFDKRLARQDIEAPVPMPPCWRPRASSVIAMPSRDPGRPAHGLVRDRGGDFAFSTALEDIHMNVEARLKEMIGEPAGRLHTGRSRATTRWRPISGSGCATSATRRSPA